MQKHICILGSGTSGLVASLIFKSVFPGYTVTVVSSKVIGIVGVGEGSTEHWNLYFQKPYDINVEELVYASKATHKYGIRFEGWTNQTPDYFHSVSSGPIGPEGFASNYVYALENNWLLTAKMSPHLYENKVNWNDGKPHQGVNQFHFDTYALNDYLTQVAKSRNVVFYEGVLTDVVRDSNTGDMTSISTDTGHTVSADFFVDASGFKRELMSRIVDNDEFVSYRDYLPCDTTAVFQTETDADGIRPYTRARAMPNGWMFEIPTQTRRGNGYIYASDFCTDEQAVKELSAAHEKDIEPTRILRWKSGYYKTSIAHNCAAIGLASSFIEPLEATSISTSIQQARMLTQLIPTFHSGNKAQIKTHNAQFEYLMDNLLTMISMHYITDRTDSAMWIEQKKAKLPETLSNLLELWKERSPRMSDIATHGYELFGVSHFWHVAQGQNLLSSNSARLENNAYLNRKHASDWHDKFAINNMMAKKVAHESLF